MTGAHKTEIGGKDLIVELNTLAKRANGSCLVRYGDTVVLATAVMSNYEREGIDFFPLTVEYEEKFYAAGKILGSRFIRRETKPSDEAILTARSIDRAIRPRFPKHLRREIQVVVTCLSWDGENDPDTIGLLAASLALSTSDIPWMGPISAVRVGRDGNALVLNPTYLQRAKSDIDLFITGMESPGDFLINMIELEGDEVDENAIVEAYRFAKTQLQSLITFQKEIVGKSGAIKFGLAAPAQDPALDNEMREFLGNKLEELLYDQKANSRRMESINDLKRELIYFVEGKYPGMGKEKYADSFFEKELDLTIHENIIKKERRPDGRKLDEIRKLEIEVGVLPRTHGSGIFTRGETKALSILTLGAPTDVRLMEGMEIRGKKRFMHHYNFPPYSSGEVKPMRGPGRREIGHGMLAERAIFPLIPNIENFPYTIRAVTEVVASNGSTSMASVSAACLAMMDAGVPIKAPAAGIAVGLMSNDKGEYKLVADIQGPEDHHGDMDFKVAGTRKGVTAIQMDVKVEGISGIILEEALQLAKKSREKILKEIENVLPRHRENLSPWAPRIYTLQIKPDKIREVIGPGGKIINEIIEKCEVSIDIEDDGKIFVTAEKEEAAKKAVEWINNITREVEVGETFQGKVKRILAFGAFVEILPGQEGLVHISQLAPYRVEKVEDIVKIGDIVPVKVISIDEQGRINLSIKETKK
ncbi:MAG: polyribonucleotide nucleotidyltransferase [Candidatus Nealsonbacteria bacterium]|nr:polyribonucleotide nucleotidyltransferase [Candidatus Nealsonbacteria bacterium]